MPTLRARRQGDCDAAPTNPRHHPPQYPPG